MSSILDRDALEHVRHVLAAVEGVLQETVQILQLDDLQRRALAAEELRDGAARDRVTDVLEPVDLDDVLITLLTGLEPAYSLLELRHRLREETPQLKRRFGNGRDPVQVGRVGDLLDVVEDVVQTGRELVDILAIEGGNEGPVEGTYDLVGQIVPLVLEVLDLPPARRKVRHVGEGLLEEAGGADDRRGLLLEQLIEAPLTGNER